MNILLISLFIRRFVFNLWFNQFLSPMNQIPFQVTVLSDSSPDEFSVGTVISTMNQCGAFLCTRGEVEVSLENESYLIRQGGIYIYMPSTLVRLLYRSPNAEGILITIDLDFILPFVQRVMNVESLLYFRKFPCLSLETEQYETLHSLLFDLYNRIQIESATVHAGNKQRVKVELLKSMGQTVVFELLNIYYENQPIQPKQQSKKDQVFQQFMLMLFKYYRQEREVSFYADMQQLTPRYFSVIIKEKSGKSALQWIVQLVITEAKLLLETSEWSIKEIAVHLNFPNQSFFGKYFKQYVGVSPKDYRANIKNSLEG